MKYYIKIHQAQGKRVIALCDENILGMTFEDGDLRLKVSEIFYKGDLLNIEELKEFIQEYTSLNAIGENIINELIKLGNINANKILKVKGVPYAMVFEI